MKKYNADSIKVLEGLNAVRKRPAMYVGSTNSYGLHHLVWEILDNSIDEIMNGFGNYISVTLTKQNSIIIEDNGRGIPIEINKKYRKPSINLIFEKLHSGGKFDSDSYKTSGGLHGVGAAVVNALSSFLKITVFRNGFEYDLIYENGGKLKSKLKKVKKTSKNGTKIEFIPDKNIFENTNFNFSLILSTVKEKAYLNKNTEFKIINENNNFEKIFCFQNGIKDYINDLVNEEETLIESVYMQGIDNNISVEIVFNFFEKKYGEYFFSFANNIKTIDGGTHVTGFKTALTKSINEYAIKENIIKNNERFLGLDVTDGLVVVISVKIPEKFIQYEGQTKTKLSTSIAKKTVEKIASEELDKYFLLNKASSQKIIEKIIFAKKTRLASKAAKDLIRNRKKIVKNEAILSGKLVPCYSKDAALSELFLVEGDSAGGTAKNARDKNYQAILPLKGKVLNSLKSNEKELLNNNEINMIINALECSFDTSFEYEFLRYHKIIIMTDADTDGAHIQILLLTFFWTHMRELIEKGNVYLALPPLYRINYIKDKKPLNQYFWDDKELMNWKLANKHKLSIQRYKGLGEMNADQLWETTMNPAKRKLIRVNINNVIDSKHKINELMGPDSDKRKLWINKYIDFTIDDLEKLKKIEITDSNNLTYETEL